MTVPSAPPPRNDMAAGVAWLLSDMTLVTGMTVLVKTQGQTYPALQMVFIRAVIGLAVITPMLWRHRRDLLAMRQPGRNLLRVSCNAVALCGNFVALSALPLALVNGISFTRPLATMLLAIALLGERVAGLRWGAAAISFAGAMVMLLPAGVEGQMSTTGVVAAFVSVVFGALALIQTRALHGESRTVMMLFYTLGLAVLTAAPALWLWQPVQAGDWPALLAIGCLAQAGQYCFLNAYRLCEASRLAPVSYLSVVFATAAGWLFFGEAPTLTVALGAALIALSVALPSLLRQPG